MRGFLLKVKILALFSAAIFVTAFLAQPNRANRRVVLHFQTKKDLNKVMQDSGCFLFASPLAVLPYIFPKIVGCEYIVNQNDRLIDLVIKILTNKRYTRQIIFIEGETAYQINKKIRECKFMYGDFVPVKDGEVFPDTYCYYIGHKRHDLVNTMKHKMQSIVNSIKNNTKLSTKEIIILASIIEKESATRDEMPDISAVFHNRLAKNMRLQSDVTTIYALSNGTGDIDRKLLREDWKYIHPHNTYRFKGLPPSPICCPGKHAIIAACNPSKRKYLYFVANHNKTAHLFSEQYDKHLSNIKLTRNTSAKS